MACDCCSWGVDQVPADSKAHVREEELVVLFRDWVRVIRRLTCNAERRGEDNKRAAPRARTRSVHVKDPAHEHRGEEHAQRHHSAYPSGVSVV